MKKMLIVLIFIAACSQSTVVEDTNNSTDVLNNESTNLIYENEFGELVSQDLSSKKTIVVFWADY
ncbi:MAG: hypothetical protein CMA19_00500 [Euryarchaeota archaeon]|nr:hypothetical protein [Euryarchaeota archaeon]|tara:strand:+ start:227 stop:421 length:195 start_codon:yes stop_codon:yes gene_type:complete